LMAMRTTYKDDFEKKHGLRLSFMSAFIAASASALVKFPSVNAEIDGTDIVFKDYVDISVAVSSKTGLVTPVMRNCETKTFADAEASLTSLALKAREGGLTLEDMTGGASAHIGFVVQALAS
jgi:2-oxoglutarate dehydrogenase E2 component (dihydrolipoamide succinyltransferase)